MKKRIVGFVLILLFTATAVFATVVKRGEEWIISYTIVWDDTREAIESGEITYNAIQNVNTDLSKWARSQLGFSSATKKVGVRTQRVVINSVTKKE
jgi:hypothetical protein